MKKLSFALLGLLIMSCSATQSGASANKPNKKTLKGTWEVTDIRFVGEDGLYKADLFDTADSPCFKGSQWVFIPNNATGKFTLSSANRCAGSTHRILWSFFDSGDGTHDFQFKFVDAKNKPLSASKSGYRMKIANLSPATMETRVKTSQGGNPFEVVLSMSKVSEDITL
ncbi:MAG: hypothetical protein AAFX53_04315 [Bacteroidota bacterium]